MCVGQRFVREAGELAVADRVSVCECLSKFGFLSKRLNGSSHFLAWEHPDFLSRMCVYCAVLGYMNILVSPLPSETLLKTLH